MHQNVNNLPVIKQGYHLEITLHPDAELEFVLRHLCLSPIEVNFPAIDDYQFSYSINKPFGLVARVVKDDGPGHLEHVETDEYHKIIIPRFGGSGILFSVPTLTIAHLEELRVRPLIIKPHRNRAVFVACTSEWDVSRSEANKMYYAYNGNEFPAALEGMLSILTEPAGETVAALDSQINRIATRLKTFQWYGKRVLSHEVRERLQFAVSDMEDQQIKLMALKKVAQKSSREAMPGFDRFLIALTTHLEEKTIQDCLAVSGLNLEALAKDADAGSDFRRFKAFTPELFDTLFSEQLSNPSYHKIKALIFSDEIKLVPLALCSKCHAPARFSHVVRSASAMADKIVKFGATCTACENKIPVTQAKATRVSAYSAWLKENGGQISEQQLAATSMLFSSMDAVELGIFVNNSGAFINATKTQRNTLSDVLPNDVNLDISERFDYFTCWIKGFIRYITFLKVV